MTATPGAVRDGLADTMRTVNGLRVYDVWPDTISLPAAVVKPVSGTPGLAFGDGVARLLFEVHLFVSLSGPLRVAQDALDGYLAFDGPLSVSAAIEADISLGGRVQYARVLGWRAYDTKQVAGTEVLGAVVDVEVVP